MKKIVSLLFLLNLFLVLNAQKINNKLGVFTSITGNIAYQPVDILNQDDEDFPDYYDDDDEPGKFNYGFTGSIGFHVIPRFVISSGIRYSYIDPNYHILYATIQPQVVISKIREEEQSFVFVNFGKKINHTATAKAGFFGLGVGQMINHGTHFGVQYQLYAEVQSLDFNSPAFIGLSIGIFVNSHKNKY